MKIKINNKPFQIKPFSEITVKEYIKFFDEMEEKTSNLEILINYIAITTGNKYIHVADIEMHGNTIRRLFAYVGEIIQADEMPESLLFYHLKTGKTLYRKSLNWRTIGARKMIEERKTENQLEQIVYLLAVYISGNYDAENTEEIYNELQDYNAINVFSFIIFFFKKLHRGKSSGKSFLRRFLKKASTNTAKQ